MFTGFLLTLFRGLTYYDELVTSVSIAPFTTFGVLKLLETSVGTLLHALASCIKGMLLTQCGYVWVASNLSLHFRHVFPYQNPHDEARVFYARSGHSSALLGRNVVAKSIDQLTHYLGLALGAKGFCGRGYKVS